MNPRDEAGFTLIELLVTMTISFIVLGATLLTFNTFLTNDTRARKVDATQDTARLGVERISRQLRNLANPTAIGGVNAPSIDLASPYDFVFLTSDPVKRRVRYCLAPSANGTNDTLQFQSSAAAGALTAAMTSACPSADGAWTVTNKVAENVVNRRASADRSVFTYGCSSRTPAGQSCTSSVSLYPRILEVRSDLFVDVNAASLPPTETRLTSGVYLRNQNEPPTATMATPIVTTATHNVRLNGSASDDPEGRTLQYQWFTGSATLPAPTCSATPPPDQTAALIGEGVTLSYTFPAAGAQQIRLRVVDAGCLTSVTTAVTVNP